MQQFGNNNNKKTLNFSSLCRRVRPAKLTNHNVRTNVEIIIISISCLIIIIIINIISIISIMLGCHHVITGTNIPSWKDVEIPPVN